MLEALSNVIEKQAELLQLEMLFLNLRGQLRMSLYDLGGQMRHLQGGVADLKKCLDLLGQTGNDPKQLYAIKANLGTALVRLGEQTSDRQILREAHGLLNLLNGPEPLDEAAPEYHNAILSICVAKHQIGSMSGDRGMVETACRDMEIFLANPHLSKETETALMINHVSALFTNARQNRSVQIYRSLIKILNPLSRSMHPELPFYLHAYADANLELSKITGEVKALRVAIGNFETVCKLLRRLAHSGPLYKALHSLASAHFNLGQHSEGESGPSFQKAIEVGEEALNLIWTKSSLEDARVTRITISLGIYRFALGKLSHSKKLISEALDNFRSAKARAPVERCPWLAFQASIGAFEIYQYKREWKDALKVFDEAEKSWEIVSVDRTLSPDVHSQQILEMAGYYAEAAHCHLQLGYYSRSVETIERGRAQKLRQLSEQRFSNEESLSPSETARLEEAMRKWEMSRKAGSTEDCAKFWKLLASVQREFGLETSTEHLCVEDIISRMPEGSVVVYLFGGSHGLHGIILFEDRSELQVIKFSEKAADRILHFLVGDEVNSWSAEYRRFRGDSSVAAKIHDEASRFSSWSHTVDAALALLGEILMEPIHSRLLELGLERGTTIFVSPPGDAASLPLANAKLSDGSHFCDYWSVSIVPCGGFLMKRPAGLDSHSKFLVISEEEQKSYRSEDLRFAIREGKVIGSHLRAQFRLSLTGKAATLRRTLEEIVSADLVHISCHGSYNDQNPELSSVNLPSGEKLPIARLKPTKEFRMQARLIFLSCCESGISGRTIPPDEFVGLLPSLVQSGVQAAIGALWPVYDDAALLLCKRFYELFLDDHGAERTRPSDALAKAQSWLRQAKISDIEETGIFTASEMISLYAERFTEVRMRGRYRDEVQWPSSEDTLKPSPESIDRSLCPYRSPVDWAAFTIVGY